MKLKPLADRVLVRAEESEEALPSGLVIPDTAKEKPQEGTVLAVGPGAFVEGQRVPMDVKAGDRIIFSKYGGTEVKVDGEELLILSERDILAVIDTKAKK
ncbi:MAG: co-chaperone GroES [Acidimicrobiia bacterium]